MDGVERRRGAKLPHWRQEAATYFVTFRLADSLPAAVVAEYRAALRRAMNTQRLRQRRPLTLDEVAAVKRRVLRSVEDILDNGIGSCLLAQPANAELVANALSFFDGQRYILHAWCVMPNHVHTVVEPLAGFDLSGILHSWKSFTAHHLPAVHEGSTWESESFDHIVRSEESYSKFVRYVEQNPIKSSLVGWKWVSSPR